MDNTEILKRQDELLLEINLHGGNNKMKSTEIIEHLINNSLKAQYYNVQDDNFGDMNEDDNKESYENTEKILELEKAILSMLPIEGQKMYTELENLWGNKLSIESQYMFKRGVIEGLTTFDYLKEASNYLHLMKL